MSKCDRVHIAQIPIGGTVQFQWVADGKTLCDLDCLDVCDLADQVLKYLRHGKPKDPDNVETGPVLQMRGRTVRLSFNEARAFGAAALYSVGF